MSDLEKTIWIDAAPEIVFQYLVDSDKVSRWCGVSAEMDPVPGGLYRLDMGVGGVMEGRFKEVELNKFIAWEMNAPEGMDAGSQIEITVTAEAGGTRVNIRQTGLGPPFDLVASRGWDNHIARLSVVAVGGSPGPDPLCERSFESLMGS